MQTIIVKKIIIFFLLGLSSIPLSCTEERLRMATTTSTENSGLLAVLNPAFEKIFNVKLDVIAVGTGKALKLGENGDVDLILVHAPRAEKKFVDDGYGIDRKAVMHNDFVIIGPKTDPIGIKNTVSLNDAMKKIIESGIIFISRGDDSGTHKKEKNIWKSVDVEPGGSRYLVVGQGMGAVLKIANDKQAYTLSDRGTWLAYQDNLDMKIVSEGDPVLFNPYHVIAINPERYSHIKYQQVTDYINFITGEEGQKIIKDFKVKGKQLFHPDALSEVITD